MAGCCCFACSFVAAGAPNEELPDAVDASLLPEREPVLAKPNAVVAVEVAGFVSDFAEDSPKENGDATGVALLAAGAIGCAFPNENPPAAIPAGVATLEEGAALGARPNERAALDTGSVLAAGFDALASKENPPPDADNDGAGVVLDPNKLCNEEATGCSGLGSGSFDAVVVDKEVVGAGGVKPNEKPDDGAVVCCPSLGAVFAFVDSLAPAVMPLLLTGKVKPLAAVVEAIEVLSCVAAGAAAKEKEGFFSPSASARGCFAGSVLVAFALEEGTAPNEIVVGTSFSPPVDWEEAVPLLAVSANPAVVDASGAFLEVVANSSAN